MGLSWQVIEEVRELAMVKARLERYEATLERIAREPIMDSVTAIKMRAIAVAALRQGGHRRELY
jgi:hypothetical protein